MSAPLRILLADPEPLFAEILETTLVREGYMVIGVATSREQLREAGPGHRPLDVCLMELDYTDGNAIDVITELAALPARPKIVVLARDARPERVERALAAGASGFVHKDRGLPALLDALSRVIAGTRVVTADMRLAPKGLTRELLDRRAAYLTPRELECLELITVGMDTVAMARHLGVSAATVRSHVQSVLTKLNVHSKVEAASLALRHGLVQRRVLRPDLSIDSPGRRSRAYFRSPEGHP